MINYAQIISRIYPLVTKASFQYTKRSFLTSAHLVGFQARATSLQARGFRTSLLLQANNYDNPNVKPTSPPAQSANSKETPKKQGKLHSSQKSKSRAKKKALKKIQEQDVDLALGLLFLYAMLSQPLFTNPPRPIKIKKSKSKREESKTPAPTLTRAQKLWQTIRSWRPKFTFFGKPPFSQEEPKLKANPFIAHPPYLTRAQMMQSLKGEFPDMVLTDDLDSHPTLLKYGLTSQGKSPNAPSYTRAEIIQSLLQDDLWGPLVENFDLDPELADGWYPGESDWMAGHRMGLLMSGFSQRELRRAGAAKDGVVSMKEFAELLAERVDDRKS